MKKITSLVIFLSLMSLASFAQKGISFNHDSWAEIVSQAKAADKLIFLDAYTAWCGPCKMLQARVFPDEKLGNYFNEHFVNTKVDMEKGEGPSLARKYPVRGYPTLLFIDPKTEKIVHSVLGYRSIEQLSDIGKKLIAEKSSTSR